jgi:hypothetical protein
MKMAIKKTAAKAASKKPVAKKPAPKASASKKPAAKKTSAANSSQAALQSLTGKKALTVLPTLKASGANTRRPTPNPPLADDAITVMSNAFSAIRDMLEEAAANIRPLDRARLNGVGIKKQGFIERAYAAAVENLQFMPPYLTIEKFRDDFQYFVNLRTLTEACTQLREFIWNLTIQGADVSYTDALEYYASVREAAQRRIDGSETIFRDLSPFFKRMGTPIKNGEEIETKKKTGSEVKALLNGKRDGKIVIENIRPKLTGGKHKVIDERFTDSAQYKETEEGEIRE